MSDNYDNNIEETESEVTYTEGDKAGFEINEDSGTLEDGRIVLCGANAYEQNFYFNRRFASIPESVQKELRIISVLFTEEVGGIFYIVYDEDGSVNFETAKDADDIYADDISAGLLIGEIRRNRQELLESLSLYYRLVILHEDPNDILKEFGDDDE